MKFSLNLIRQYVDLDGISLDVFCEKCSLAGFEIEGVYPMAQATNLVIGKVLSCKAHPNSDHLHVCEVDVKDTILQIVCGAPNVRVGIKVIVALVGAELKAKNITIQSGKIRDVVSNGMLCSLVELGVDENLLSEEQKQGIEILNEDAVVGNHNVLAYLGLDDVMIDMSVTPNRNDVLAIYSLCKELGAIFDRKVKIPEIIDNYDGDNDFICDSITDKCRYFSIRSIRGVDVHPSPLWMQDILKKHEIKPINNVIDIGNYVTLMTGQPLHMYDADQLETKKYLIKDQVEEKVLALDDKEYQIQKNDIVVTNGNKMVCIAGVIGDNSTKITEHTKNIALEAALFDGYQIATSCKRYGILTVAASNFSKKVVDEYSISLASAMAANLLKEYAGAKSISKLNCFDHRLAKVQEIEITIDEINHYLATHFTEKEITSVWQRLNFEYAYHDSSYVVKIPTYRNDISLKADLIEEVVRLLGFENVPFSYPLFDTQEKGLTDIQQKRNLIKNYLLDLGLNETLSYTLISKSTALYYDVFDHDDFIVLNHPLTVEKEYLRKNLMPSLLQTIAYNQARKIEQVAIFEMSNVYSQQNEGEKLAIAISNGLNTTQHFNDRKVDFYMIKGIVEGLLALFGIDATRYAFENFDKYYPKQILMHPGKSAVLKINGQIFGFLGEVHPQTLQRENLAPTLYFELDLKKFMELKTNKIKYQPISKFPPVNRDIALLVKADLPVIQLIKTIKKAGGSLLQKVEVFDVYQGEHVQNEYKSVALTMTFVDSTKTLLDADIQQIFNKIYEACQKECQAEIRK